MKQCELNAGSGKLGGVVIGDQEFGVLLSVIVSLCDIGKPCRSLNHDAGTGIKLSDKFAVVIGKQEFSF